MGAGWLRFGRKQAQATPNASDNAVREAPTWLLCAVIVASTAALLGTSEEGQPSSSPDTSPSQPSVFTTYNFARSGIDGGSVELTAAAPSAPLYVIITVTDLGPDGVLTTASGVAHLRGAVTASDLTVGTAAPQISVVASSPDDPSAGSTLDAVGDIALTQRLTFIGDCQVPMNGDCKARFAVKARRSDDGLAGGKLSIRWSIDLESTGQLPAATASTIPAQDPPWTVEISGP